MKIKFQFGIFAVLLAFLGTYLEQVTVANQQIVIQFSDENISSKAAENTIDIVKKQLQSIGVSQIEIGKHQDGKLIIKYYSDANIVSIQNVLSLENNLKFAHHSDSNNSNDFPDNNTEKDYELNISEIQNTTNTNWDFEGIQVVELNQKSEHSYNPKVNTSGEQINIEQSNTIAKVAILVSSSVALAIDKNSYNIPEVRAGPSNKETLI